MQLLVVHAEAEMGAGLCAMLQEYGGHAVAYAASAAAAESALGQSGAGCDLLLTQLEAEGIDGLALQQSLGEMRPALEVFFLPHYPLAEQRLEVAQTKIFPEPIDGERLLQAVARVAEKSEHETEANAFHLIDLLQMFCLSGKSGALQIMREPESGVIFLRNGELRHAVTPRASGLDAIGEMLSWGPRAFRYDSNASPADQTIAVGWDAALVDVVLRAREARTEETGVEASPAPEVAAAELPPEPDLTGRDFGTYRVGRKLTESFWDKVYEAQQTSIGRPVALHVLRSSLRDHPEHAQAFLDAASVNANVRHPSILPVYEAGEIEGTYFYAREFVAGRTLYEIKAGGLTISSLIALRIIRAVADALAHLEAHQILHAPLRLSRIFVTPNEEAKLADIAVANPAMAQLAPAQSEIQMLGRLLIPMTKATARPGSGRVLQLIHRMQTTGEEAITDWAALATEAKRLETTLAPPPFSAAKRPGLLGKILGKGG